MTEKDKWCTGGPRGDRLAAHTFQFGEFLHGWEKRAVLRALFVKSAGRDWVGSLGKSAEG